jgi:hypothetical protein
VAERRGYIFPGPNAGIAKLRPLPKKIQKSVDGSGHFWHSLPKLNQCESFWINMVG